MRKGFNLGFYFDIKLKEQLFIHTGLIMKSPMGADALKTYPLAIPELDTLLAGGEIRRKLGYINIPVMLRYRLKNFVYAEAGMQVGLKTKAIDEFTSTVQTDEDLRYLQDIKDDVNTIDYGAIFGLGHKLKQGTGMNVGLRYYLGLADIYKNNPGDPFSNRVLYVYLGIPIGAKKE